MSDANEEDPACANCGCELHLADGMEWPDDGIPIMCWECQHAERRRLHRVVDRLAAETNRRRGEMAVAREALTEAGVPAKDDGITLTMSQRIRRLAESKQSS